MSNENIDDDDNYCSFTGNEHKYFIFKTIETYEPFTPSPDFVDKYGAASFDFCASTVGTADQLYRKTERVTLGCNCGSVISKAVVIQ